MLFREVTEQGAVTRGMDGNDGLGYIWVFWLDNFGRLIPWWILFLRMWWVDVREKVRNCEC